MSHAELAVSYAALVLADDGVDVTVRALPRPYFGGTHKSQQYCYDPGMHGGK